MQASGSGSLNCAGVPLLFRRTKQGDPCKVLLFVRYIFKRFQHPEDTNDLIDKNTFPNESEVFHSTFKRRCE